MSFASLREADSKGALSSVRPVARYRSFHLVVPGSGVFSGSEAILPLAAMLLPGTGRLCKLLDRVPGVRGTISFGYSALSRMHDVGACASGGRR